VWIAQHAPTPQPRNKSLFASFYSEKEESFLILSRVAPAVKKTFTYPAHLPIVVIV
jgi:hypothetical protein